MVEVWWRRALGALALAAALALVAVAAGLVPPREPGAPESQPFSVHKTTPPASLLRPSAPQAAPSKGVPAKLLSLPLVPLCEAPERGARFFKVQLSALETNVLVWCKQGFELFSIAAKGDEGLPEVTRLARFKAHGELPGGAAAGDFDADGQLDLVLGIAAREGLVHRSGAGVFWLRGRAQGGFEPARILAETGSTAVAAFAVSPGPAHELLVLTAGDVAAQRPGEVWLFGRSPTLMRQRVVPAGLDPRGLALRAGADSQALEAWVLSGQPGRLDRFVIDLGTRDVRHAEAASLALRGAQALGHEPSPDGALFVRDATSLWRVDRAAPPKLVPFVESAHVGPFVLTDLDGDLKLDVLAAVDDGVAWFVEGAATSERDVPAELKVLDVETANAPLDLGAGPALAFALVRGPDAGQLSLVMLPRPPWAPSAAPVTLTRMEPRQAQSLASVVLE